MSRAIFHVGDVFERMAQIPDGSVDLIVTSPPFLALRSYLPADHLDKAKEIGSEATPAAFLSTLLALTREWRRVLAPHGSICVELGDTYSGSGGAGGDYGTGGLREGQGKFDGSGRRNRPADVAAGILPPQSRPGPAGRDSIRGWPLAKSLCLLPSLYAGSLAYGRNLLEPADTIDPLRVRNLIVWHRPNPPVGALGDKVRPSTSYITVACPSTRRWFDLDAERTEALDQRPRNTNGSKHGNPVEVQTANLDVRVPSNPAGAPPLDAWTDIAEDGVEDVWTIPTQPYAGAHYATFPIALPRKLIRLMCPMHVCVLCGEPRRRIVEITRPVAADDRQRVKNANGERPHIGRQDRAPEIGWQMEHQTLGWSDCGHDDYRRGHVLDPFAGSGTTLAAATEQGRDATGIDLDDRNLDLARARIGMFLEESA